MSADLTVALVGGDPATRDRLAGLIARGFDGGVELIALTEAAPPRCVLVLDSPRGEAVATLERWAAEQVGQRFATVVVGDAPELRRASLRAGAGACVALASLTEQGLRRAIEDASARLAAVENHRIRQLADALPALVSYIDADQRYVFLNRGYEASFQRPVAELVGETVAEVLGPRNYATIGPRLARALGGEQVRGEQALELPDGRVVHVDANYVPDRRADGTIAGCFVMVVDISERKQAEDLTRRVLDSLFAFVGILALDGTLLEVNAAPLEVAGLTLAEVRGKKVWDAYWWSYSPVIQAQLREACERAAAGETVRYDVEVRVADGGRMIIDFQLAPLRDGEGRITHLIPSAVDVTHRVRVEQRLRESDRRKDEYLAMLGHELRNPLAAICSASELLALHTGDDARLSWVAEALDRQARHMVRLVDGLLEVSRIAQGKILLERRAVDLGRVLAAVLGDRSAALAGAGLELELELPERPLWVWGDEVRLTQIFDNLIGNAIKFTAAPGMVRVVARREHEDVLVLVADTGVGVRPDLLEAIFEPFAQAEPQQSRVSGGLGIGLALVRGLVELHRGTVVARSDGPGQGAEFEVRLPAQVG